MLPGKHYNSTIWCLARTFVYYFFFSVFTFILLLQEMDLGRPEPIPSNINSSKQGALKFNMFSKKKMQE